MVNINNNLHNRDKNEVTEKAGEDKFEIKMIYPTNTLGQTWYAKWDDGTSRTLGTNQKDPLDNDKVIDCVLLKMIHFFFALQF